jgi:ankyrin repeat protein
VTEQLDDATLAYPHRMVDLARAGGTEALAAQVDAGLPANLTDAKGDTLLVLAAYHDHPDTVAALLAAGADPAAGGPSALETADFFGLPEMRDLLLRRADIQKP